MYRKNVTGVFPHTIYFCIPCHVYKNNTPNHCTRLHRYPSSPSMTSNLSSPSSADLHAIKGYMADTAITLETFGGVRMTLYSHVTVMRIFPDFYYTRKKYPGPCTINPRRDIPHFPKVYRVSDRTLPGEKRPDDGPPTLGCKKSSSDCHVTDIRILVIFFCIRQKYPGTWLAYNFAEKNTKYIFSRPGVNVTW